MTRRRVWTAGAVTAATFTVAAYLAPNLAGRLTVYLLLWTLVFVAAVALWIGACEAGRYLHRRRHPQPATPPPLTVCDTCAAEGRYIAVERDRVAHHIATTHPGAQVRCHDCRQLVNPDCWDAHRRLAHNPDRPQGVEDRPDWSIR